MASSSKDGESESPKLVSLAKIVEGEYPHFFRYLWDRPYGLIYLPDEYAEYQRKRKERLANPTAKDETNRLMYGDKWKRLIGIPLPPKVPHPEYVEMMNKLDADSEVRKEFEETMAYIKRRRQEIATAKKIRNE